MVSFYVFSTQTPRVVQGGGGTGPLKTGSAGQPTGDPRTLIHGRRKMVLLLPCFRLGHAVTCIRLDSLDLRFSVFRFGSKSVCMETLVQEKSPLFKMLPEGVRDWYFEEMLGQMYKNINMQGDTAWFLGARV